MEIEVFYRDGANYKYTAVFPITYEQLQEIAKKYGKGLSPGDEIEYDTDLGISRGDFHNAIGSPYYRKYDHNIVEVVGITTRTEKNPSREFKQQLIKQHVAEMLNDSYWEMLNKIDKALNCGAIDVDAWDPDNNRMIVPKVIVATLLQREAEQYDAKGTSFEKAARKEINNLKCFI